jgi:hypothetical protein
MSTSTNTLLTLLLAVAVTAALAPAGVLAQEDPATDPDDADLDNLVDIYNANVDQVPGIIRGQIADESVELRYGEGDTVATSDTGSARYFTTDGDAVITDYGEGDAENPSVRIRTSEATYQAIVTSDDPPAEFVAQYEAGNVKVNGVGVGKSVTLEAAKLAYSIGKSLGLI